MARCFIGTTPKRQFFSAFGLTLLYFRLIQFKAWNSQWSEWWLVMATVDDKCSTKIIFTDNIFLSVESSVSRIAPFGRIVKPMHHQRITVWCCLWTGGIIGPYFFKNQAGQAVTVNGVWYREMITNFLGPN